MSDNSQRRRSYAVRFLKNGELFSARSINADSNEAAMAEAQRRIAEGGVIGIRERGSPGKSGYDDYVFGRPNAGITVWCAVESGDATELGERDLAIEQARREGRPYSPPEAPLIPF